jgi:hypothetical protein
MIEDSFSEVGDQVETRPDRCNKRSLAMSKTFVELEAECLQLLEADRLAKLRKAEVLNFPTKLAEAERERQLRVAEQDRLRREEYQRLCDATWQANLDRWAARDRGYQGCHRGPRDDDRWPA